MMERKQKQTKFGKMIVRQNDGRVLFLNQNRQYDASFRWKTSVLVFSESDALWSTDVRIQCIQTYSTLPKKWQFEQMAKSTGNALQRFREQMAIRTNGNSSSPGFKENWKWQDGVGGLEVLHEVAVAGFRNGGFGECSFQRSNVHSAPT